MEGTLEKFWVYVEEHYEIQGEYRPNEEFLSVTGSLNKMDSDHTLEELVTDMKNYVAKKRNHVTFTILLEKYREEKNLSPAEVYKTSLIDRRLYNKMMSDRKYHPDKNTVIALGLALNLNNEQMTDFLASAGYHLSDCILFDLSIKFCIDCNIYNIHDVNALLFVTKQRVLCKE